MHEMSIAASLLEQVLRHAEQNHAARVQSLEVDVGRMQAVELAALAFAWEAVRCETAAEGAELSIAEVAAKARCRRCEKTFEPDVDYSFACPDCRVADVEILAGNDIILKSITFELPEGAPTP